MKNNYPIKYAVIPMIEQIGWTSGLHELEREYGTVCYIVSKCFLLNEEIIYDKEGTSKKRYKVKFPFSEDSYYPRWEREDPIYSFNGDAIDVLSVDKVYDNYEEAKEEKEYKNIVLRTNRLSLFMSEEENAKSVNEFNNTLEYYNKLESLIEDNTKDLVVNNKPKEQNFISLSNGEYCRHDLSLYYLIESDYVYEKENYIAYTVTEEEYKKLKTTLPDDIKDFIHTPLMIHTANSKIIKLITDDEPKYIKPGRYVKLIEEDIKMENMEKVDRIVFTLENYKDILNSYHINEENQRVIQLRR